MRVVEIKELITIGVHEFPILGGFQAEAVW